MLYFNLIYLRNFLISAWRRRTAFFRLRDRRSLLRAVILGASFLTAMLVLFLLSVRIGVFGKIPSRKDLREIKNPTASLIYDVNGVLIGKYFIENRTNVSFGEISPFLIQALVTTEDVRFYEHNGVDLRSWMRVLFRNILLFDRSAGGGSTIHQQLAKNLFKRKRYWFFSTPINKSREIFTALKMHRVYSKEEILTLYLNTVPFGGNEFGIDVAAKAYFNTTPENLTIQDAAMLVGMLKATSFYNPHHRSEQALARRNTVIDQMTRYNQLQPTVADSLKCTPLKTTYVQESHDQGIATYFREELRQACRKILDSLAAIENIDYNLYSDGLRIHTTIDSRLQRHAESAVNYRMKHLQDLFEKHWKGGKPWRNDAILDDAIAKSSRYKSWISQGYSQEYIDSLLRIPLEMEVFSWDDTIKRSTISPLDSIKYYLSLLHSGFLASDYRTGEIKAWVGGIDFAHFKYDHVRSTRQVGSTFKPFVYAKALESGYSPCDYFENVLVTYNDYDAWTPRNSNGEYGGYYSLEGAFAKSINTISVDLLFQLGIQEVVNMARKCGITSQIPVLPSIALGTADISLFEMVQAFSTIANDGNFIPLHYLKRIENSRGDTIYLADNNSEKIVGVLDTATAQTLKRMMQSVIEAGTGVDLKVTYGLEGDIAGKTGTTQSHSDGWFIGFTPDIIAGSWVGAESPAVSFRSLQLGQGAFTAMPIWAGFYARATRTRAFEQWKLNQFTYDEGILQSMNCPFYMEDDPSFFLDLLFADSGEIRSKRRGRQRDRQTLGEFLKNLFRRKN